MAKAMTEGSPARLIWNFTLPLLAGNIVEQLYSFVDTLLVGRFLGVSALAAVGCTGGLMFLLFGFLMGAATGLTVLTGQRFGAQDMQGVRRSAAVSMTIGFIVATLVACVAVPMARTMLVLMQTPPDILDNAVLFIRIIFASAPLIMLFAVIDNLVRALGDSRTAMVLLVLGLVCNIVLEPLFILVFGWGIAGAAFALTVAHVGGIGLSFLYIKRKLPELLPHREDWNFSRKEMLAHLKLGVPMGFQTSIVALGAIIIQVPLNHLGEVAVAAYAAAQKVGAIGVFPMISFGMAMAVYTAQNYGAGKYDRIRAGVRACIKMSGAFSLLVGLFMYVFGGDIISLFITEDAPQVVAYGHTYLIIDGACYLILSLLFIFRFTLQGLGQTLVPTIAGFMELLMRVFAAFFLAAPFGFIGVCVGNPLAWFGSLVPLSIAYWRIRKKLHDPVPSQNVGTCDV